MIYVLIILSFASSVFAKDWFNVLDNCQKQSVEKRESSFKQLNKKWNGKLERTKDDLEDYWREPTPKNLDPSITFVMAILGNATTSLELCRNTTAGKVQKPKGINLIPKDKKWYRAFTHKQSCELPPLSTKDVTTWMINNLANRYVVKTCDFKIISGPLGKLIQTTCDDNFYSFTDSYLGCDFMLGVQKENLDSHQLETFGWKAKSKK